MGKFKFNISLSLDGYVAGPNQSVDNPLGVGGEQLHEWAFSLAAWRKPHGIAGGAVNASSQILDELNDNVGAVVIGRKMFGGHPGPWRESPWNGWWGEDPPFHNPVFVLTHHAREPLAMKGGTTFHFVTDGIRSALQQAKDAAQGKDVLLSGGADVAQQYLAAGLVDELNLSVIPVLLHDGERLFDKLAAAKLTLEQVRVIEAPGVTHIRYQAVR